MAFRIQTQAPGVAPASDNEAPLGYLNLGILSKTGSVKSIGKGIPMLASNPAGAQLHKLMSTGTAVDREAAVKLVASKLVVSYFNMAERVEDPLDL